MGQRVRQRIRQWAQHWILRSSLVAVLVAVLVTLNTSSMLAEISIVALFFWKVATFGFILHRAMSIGVGLGVVAGLFILIFTFAVSQVAIGL